jgi:hypothetical protein
MQLGKWLAPRPLALVALGILASGRPPSAVASCAGLQPLPRVLATAPVVFVGTVVSTRDRSSVAIVRVDEVWRGTHVPKVAVVANDSTEDSRSFRVGVTYLFVPVGRPRVSPYEDNACSATRRYTRALTKYRPRNAHRP